MALDAQAAEENRPKRTVKKSDKPPLKHLLHDDTSLEKLTINMAVGRLHGAVAFYSELAAWFASFTRYSSSGDDSSGRAHGTGPTTPNASSETGSRTKARRSSFPSPPSRLSA